LGGMNKNLIKGLIVMTLQLLAEFAERFFESSQNEKEKSSDD